MYRIVIQEKRSIFTNCKKIPIEPNSLFISEMCVQYALVQKYIFILFSLHLMDIFFIHNDASLCHFIQHFPCICSMIQLRTSVTREYTPGISGLAHPKPYETTPTRYVLPPDSYVNGPNFKNRNYFHYLNCY